MKEVEISGAYFSTKHFKETWTPKQLAEMFCTLNSWKTPKEFELGRELNREEVKKVMSVLKEVVPKRDWLPVWQTRNRRFP